MPLICRRADATDFPALQQMLELYQYELSDFWHQELDAQARYGYDLQRYQEATRFFADVALEGSQYLGLALVAPAGVTLAEGSWLEQFFILKRYRRAGAGRTLAGYCVFRPIVTGRSGIVTGDFGIVTERSGIVTAEVWRV